MRRARIQIAAIFVCVLLMELSAIGWHAQWTRWGTTSWWPWAGLVESLGPCTPLGTRTTNLGLCKPATGETNWSAAMNGNLDVIDSIASPAVTGIICNVKAFGAKGDGTTDDTAAIAATIASCAAAGGGIVYYSSGIYKTTSTLTVSSNGITFMGTGFGAAQIRRAGAFVTLNIGDSLDFRLYDLYLNGNGFQEDVWQVGSGTGGALNIANPIIAVRMKCGNLVDSSTSTKACIYANKATVLTTILDSVFISPGAVGIRNNASSAPLYLHRIILNGFQNACLYSSGATGFGALVYDSWMLSCRDSVFQDTIGQLHIRGSYIENSARYALNLNAVKDVKLHDNYFTGWSGGAMTVVQLAGDVSPFHATGNTVNGTGAGGAVTPIGYSAFAPTSKGLVTGNVFLATNEPATDTGLQIFNNVTPGNQSTFAQAFQGFLFSGVAQGALGTPGDGVVTYCTDCTIANPCAGGGNGALAKRLNGVWVCN